jgi:hypothetical protein
MGWSLVETGAALSLDRKAKVEEQGAVFTLQQPTLVLTNPLL